MPGVKSTKDNVVNALRFIATLRKKYIDTDFEIKNYNWNLPPLTQEQICAILGIEKKELSIFRHHYPNIFDFSNGKTTVDTLEFGNWLRQYFANRNKKIDHFLTKIEIELTQANEALSEDSYDLHFERAVNLRADTKLKEIREKILKNEYVSVKLITTVLSDLAAQISTILENIPYLLRSRVRNLTNSDIEIITKEIVKCQNACSEVKINVNPRL